MTLADQIIEHGPVQSDDPVPQWFEALTAKGINALRDELLELRQLRAAAEQRERLADLPHFAVDAHVFGGKPGMTLACDRCANWFDILNGPTWLAELVRRADQHTEDCT